jgi:general stress protein 26
MTTVTAEERESFFSDVDAACREAIWAAIASVHNGEPRVRLVHPTWEGDTLWIATGNSSPKAAQYRANPNIDIQYQASPPNFVHIMVRGTVEVLDDQATREHCWNAMDYELADFWPDGPTSDEFVCLKITPTRVELSEMFGTTNKRVWRA